MTLSAAAIRLMATKGLSADDIADIAEANEPARSSAATRQKRYRDSKKRNEHDVTRDVTPPLNEDTSNPLDPQSAKADMPPLAVRVVDAWNAGPRAKGATGAIPLDANRRKWLSLRVREHGEPAVFAAIANIGASPFHCGVSERGWKANIGWLLSKPENFLKALEMGQDAAPASAKPVDPDTFRAFCLTSAERCRSIGREQEALDWEAKSRGEEPRRASTGPPRSIASLIPDHLKSSQPIENAA